MTSQHDTHDTARPRIADTTPPSIRQLCFEVDHHVSRTNHPTTTIPATAVSPARFDVRQGIWLLPVFGALMTWATFEHQPDPTTEFRSWSRFVSTDRFLVSHLAGSILGQAIYLLGAIALAAAVLLTTRRQREAVAGIVAAVLGSAGLLAGFGAAAFAQPAIGRLELAGSSDARQIYDDVYRTPAMITLLGGAALFAMSTVLLARAAAAAGAARWATVAFGLSGPLIGIIGIAVGPAQTLGAFATMVGGIGLAHTLRGQTASVNTRGTLQ